VQVAAGRLGQALAQRRQQRRHRGALLRSARSQGREIKFGTLYRGLQLVGGLPRRELARFERPHQGKFHFEHGLKDRSVVGCPGSRAPGKQTREQAHPGLEAH
jgi:hypothetical protein